jgi:hypothetical protein
MICINEGKKQSLLLRLLLRGRCDGRRRAGILWNGKNTRVVYSYLVAGLRYQVVAIAKTKAYLSGTAEFHTIAASNI